MHIIFKTLSIGLFCYVALLCENMALISPNDILHLRTIHITNVSTLEVPKKKCSVSYSYLQWIMSGT